MKKDMDWVYRKDGVDASSKMGPQGSRAATVKKGGADRMQTQITILGAEAGRDMWPPYGRHSWGPL